MIDATRDGFEVVKNPVTESQSEKIAEEQAIKYQTVLFESVLLLGTQMRNSKERTRQQVQSETARIQKTKKMQDSWFRKSCLS